MPCQTTRRAFLKSPSADAALSMTALGYGRIRGANDRLGIAVTIASCDHQHEEHLKAAAEAQKDVYDADRREMVPG